MVCFDYQWRNYYHASAALFAATARLNARALTTPLAAYNFESIRRFEGVQA